MHTTSEDSPAKTASGAMRTPGRRRQQKKNVTPADGLEHIEDGYFEVDLSGSFEIFMEASPDPIVIYDLEGKTKYLNPSFERTFGWSREELAGKRIDFVPEQQRQETQWAIEQLRARKSVTLFETKRLTKGGRVLDVQLSSAVYSDAGGRPGGIIVILRDISEIKQAQNALTESERRLSILIQESPYGISIIDHNGVYRYLNRKFTEIFGYSLQDIPDGRSWFNCAFPDSAERRRAVSIWKTEHATWVPGETKPYVRRVTCKNGEKKVICFRPVIMPSREYFVSYEDITERETAKKKLVKAHRELKQAHHHLQSLETLREKAVHHLSHELRTPVAVLDAILKILGKEETTSGTENYARLIERGRRCLQRLNAIQFQMDDVAVLSQEGEKERLATLVEELRWIRQQGVETDMPTENLLRLLVEKAAPADTSSAGRTEKLDLRELIQAELDKAQELCPFRVLRLLNKADAGLAVHLDRSVAGKVVGGLVRNAIENTPDGGLIVVKARAAGPEAVIEVIDFGVGITPDNQRNLFKGFFHTQDTKLYSTKRLYEFNAGGSGSDLMRMRLFAERLGFSISFKSRRCCYIPSDDHVCSGSIARCRFVRSSKECMRSGGSKFVLAFPQEKFLLEPAA